MKKANPQKGKDETQDTFYHGRILVYQKKEGYRFAVDAPLLADFIQTKDKDKCLELGTGCGIISLLLSVKPFMHITALEIQESLAGLAKRNVQLNHLDKRICVIHVDFFDFLPPHKFDVVFSNPPYIKKQTGRMSATSEKWVAKHEVKCDILGIMQKTSALLKKNGRAYFIFTAKRKLEFTQAVDKAGLDVQMERLVYPREGGAPNFLLSQCGFPPCQKRILSPLFLFDDLGKYTPEAEEIFSGRTHASFI
ncbi:MAG: methyltransferase [Candidatus Aminicenantes bacterium]|nr:MAG: methyltransferase [Candidatus Aminicenantes bacterium]